MFATCPVSFQVVDDSQQEQCVEKARTTYEPPYGDTAACLLA
jgi:hypothetical protein